MDVRERGTVEAARAVPLLQRQRDRLDHLRPGPQRLECVTHRTSEQRLDPGTGVVERRPIGTVREVHPAEQEARHPHAETSHGLDTAQRGRQHLGRDGEQVSDPGDEVERAQDQQVVERIVTRDRAQGVQVGRRQERGGVVRASHQIDERALQWRGVGRGIAQQRRHPARVSSCSLQEALVGVDSVVAVLEACDGRGDQLPVRTRGAPPTHMASSQLRIMRRIDDARRLKTCTTWATSPEPLMRRSSA